MRILYVVGDPSIRISDNRGYSRHITECIHALSQLGHDVRLITAHDDGSAGRQKQILGKAKKVMPSKVSALVKDAAKVLFDRRYRTRVEAAFDDFKPDILYNRYSVFHRCAVEIAQLRRIPCLVEVNATFREAVKYLGLGLTGHAARVERTVLRSADAILVVSEPIKTELIHDGIESAKIVVNPNGVDTDKFSPSVDGDVIRRRHGLDGRLVVGFVGSLSPRTGVENLIDSAAVIRTRYPEARFLIAGSGDLRDLLEQKINDLGIAEVVVFAGKVPMDEVPSYLSAIDIAAVPYTDPEQVYGSSTKLYESMASARAIVASKVAQMATVLEDGVTGLFVTPGDTNDLTEKIICLLDKPELRKEMGLRAREVVLNGHTWRNNGERIVRVCEALTDGRRDVGSLGAES